MKKITAIICLFIFVFSSIPAQALFIAGQEFVSEYEYGKIVLELNGASLCRFKTNRVFAAGLYVKEKVNPRDTLDVDVAKRIEMVFLQNIAKKELFDEITRSMRDSVDEEMYQQLETRITHFQNFIFDMEEGDRFVATYFESRGTIFELNGTELITIEGGDFAFAFFSVFVGMKPLDIRAKTKLLGPLKK